MTGWRAADQLLDLIATVLRQSQSMSGHDVGSTNQATKTEMLELQDIVVKTTEAPLQTAPAIDGYEIWSFFAVIRSSLRLACETSLTEHKSHGPFVLRCKVALRKVQEFADVCKKNNSSGNTSSNAAVRKLVFVIDGAFGIVVAFFAAVAALACSQLFINLCDYLARTF